VTLRTEILAWIMNSGGRETDDILFNVFGQEAVDEILSLLELRVLDWTCKGDGTLLYEVTKIWVRRKG
jgi:hypothetical protein